MPGLPSVTGSSQAWASVGSMWSTSLNEGWLPEWKIGSTGGFTVPCSPSSSAYIFYSTGDGTTGASGNGFYSLGRKVRVVQGSTTFMSFVATALASSGLTVVGLSSGSMAPTAGLSTGVAFTSAAVGTESPQSLAGSTSSATATKFHREDGTWAAPAGAVKETGYSEAAFGSEEATTSTSFADLSTVGPTVTMTAVLNDWMDCHFSLGYQYHSANNGQMNTAPKLDADVTAANDGAQDQPTTAGYVTAPGWVKRFASLSAASHTVKAQYKVTAGTGTWNNRRMIVYRGAS